MQAGVLSLGLTLEPPGRLSKLAAWVLPPGLMI